MSVQIVERDVDYERCAFCIYFAKFTVKSSRIAGVFNVCGSLDCQAKGVKGIKDRLALVTSDDDVKPTKEKRGRDEEVPWQLSGFDYERLAGLPTEKLESLCIERDLAKSGTKGQRAQRLIDWKRNGFSAPKKQAKEEETIYYCVAELKKGGRCGAKSNSYSSYCNRHF